MAGPETPEPSARRRGGWWRKLTQVRVALPAAVGLGLLAYVISIAVAPESGDQIWHIVERTWWVVLLLTFPYLALRALVWRALLEHLKIDVPWRPMLVSFATGEMTKSLPAGIYVQNFILARLEHFGGNAVARASMATTAMLGLESAIAFPVGMVLGLPGQPWVRWTLLSIVLAWVVGLVLAWLLLRFGAQHLPRSSPSWVRRVIRFLEEFFEAGGELVSWRTARRLPLAALYLLIYAIDLYVIIHAVGLSQIDFLDAVGIHALITLSDILVPIPTEIGLTEFAGLVILVAYGIPYATSAVVILAMRALATGMTILVAGVLLLLLRDQFSRPRRGVPVGAAPSHAEASRP